MEKPQNIYDNEKFYKEYRDMREKGLNANELVEIPNIKEMLPDLKGKRILDLGCGNGGMSKYFIEQGAKSVLAIDLSSNMLNEAREKNSDENITYVLLGMEDISKIEGKFDMVFSSLAFHYVQDYDKLVADIYNLLDNDGILLYSQEHPMATAPKYHKEMKSSIFIDDKRYYVVSDYNDNGERKLFWNVDGVIKYHRNISSIINTLIKNKYKLLEVKESIASKEAIELNKKYENQMDRPYFLYIKASK
jgi:cyclopropane fatty-acyl-phospholipid synthase-like methyltransferase